MDTNNSSNVEGPGAAAVVADRQKPLLDGLDDNFYVEILNPLTVTFRGRVASSRPVHSPMTVVTSRDTPTITRTEEDVRRNYGLDLRNADHPSQQHFAQTIDIPPGATIRLPGSEAQVVLRQLVNLVMDKEGNKLLKGDSVARREVEERLVIRQGTMNEFFTQQNVDIRKVLNEDLEPEQPHEEQSFPSETGSTGQSGRANTGSGNETTQPEQRSSGSKVQKTAA